MSQFTEVERREVEVASQDLLKSDSIDKSDYISGIEDGLEQYYDTCSWSW